MLARPRDLGVIRVRACDMCCCICLFVTYFSQLQAQKWSGPSIDQKPSNSELMSIPVLIPHFWLIMHPWETGTWMKNCIPNCWEREWEACIPGNSRPPWGLEWEFPPWGQEWGENVLPGGRGPYWPAPSLFHILSPLCLPLSESLNFPPASTEFRHSSLRTWITPI